MMSSPGGNIRDRGAITVPLTAGDFQCYTNSGDGVRQGHCPNRIFLLITPAPGAGVYLLWRDYFAAKYTADNIPGCGGAGNF